MSRPGSRPLSRRSSGPPSCPCSPTCHEHCCLAVQGDMMSLTPSRKVNSITGSATPPSAYGSMEEGSNHFSNTQSGDMSANQKSLEESIRCECHDKPKTDPGVKKARNKLIIACFMALGFMVAEVIGGYLAHSLAIMTDAAHMLSDFASFLISLFAIWIATRPPSKKFSFGWHRAEVVGAVISVLIIWVLTGVLVYEAILRCIHRDFEIHADIMLITACGGVFVNVFMMAVLGHGHGHSHGGGGHGHSHGGGGGGGGGHSHGDRKTTIAAANSEEQGLLDSHEDETNHENSANKKNDQNINVRAAFIHVIGDLIQSIGVVTAGYIVWFKPEWKLADPICTFLFSILVLFSTINVLRDALRVLMEGTPRHIDYEEVKKDLVAIPGVKAAHNLQIWSLTMNKTAAAAHLALERNANNQQVLQQASRILKEKYSVHQSTLQVEDYAELMDNCTRCTNV